jgi:hypothetical protein
MIYVRDLAAVVGLTLVVAGGLPMAAKLKGKTLLSTRCQTGNATNPVVRDCFGRKENTGVTSQTCTCSTGTGESSQRCLSIIDESSAAQPFFTVVLQNPPS